MKKQTDKLCWHVEIMENEAIPRISRWVIVYASTEKEARELVCEKIIGLIYHD